MGRVDDSPYVMPSVNSILSAGNIFRHFRFPFFLKLFYFFLLILGIALIIFN